MIREHMQRSRWTPWIGLLAPPVAWAIHHQVGADLVFYDCRLGDVAVVAGVGLTMGLISAVSGWISWSSRRGGQEMELRTLAAYVGAMSGAIFFLALAFQTLATLLLPACHR
jgi:hypothetical protein